MESDDAQVGRLLTRREALSLLGLSGAGLLLGCRTSRTVPAPAGTVPNCVVRPEQTEGPYFVEERLNRTDIRSDPTTGEVRPGAPLALAIQVSRLGVGRCEPLPGALVDVWHCDALGIYSDVHDPGFDTKGQKFLRGYQVTDEEGIARFTTIYPGWYPGRTVHIHFKVRTDAAAARGREFTSQLYFDDALTDRVHARPPYSAKGERSLRNARDGIFSDGGDQLMLAVTETRSGYAGTFDMALQLD